MAVNIKPPSASATGSLTRPGAGLARAARSFNRSDVFGATRHFACLPAVKPNPGSLRRHGRSTALFPRFAINFILPSTNFARFSNERWASRSPRT